MTLFEPTLPSFPVNVTGFTARLARTRPLQRLRRNSCYRSARAALRLAFALEVLLALVAVGYFVVQRGGWAAVLAGLGAAVGLTMSFAAMEVGVALLDCADLQLGRRQMDDASQ